MDRNQTNMNEKERISMVKTLLSTLISEYYSLITLENDPEKHLNKVFESINKISRKYSYDCQTTNLNIFPIENTHFRPIETKYANASIIKANNIGHTYILTQGPINGITDEFWTMVWNSDASVIVCLVNQIEMGKIKFDLYYDDIREVSFGNCSVTVLRKYRYNQNIIIRELSVTRNIDALETKTITHIQYIGWPDHGIPSNISEFSEICLITNQFSSYAPIIIHCGDGVGRSGIMCVVHKIINLIYAFLRGKNFNWSNLPMFSELIPQNKGEEYIKKNIFLLRYRLKQNRINKPILDESSIYTLPYRLRRNQRRNSTFILPNLLDITNENVIPARLLKNNLFAIPQINFSNDVLSIFDNQPKSISNCQKVFLNKMSPLPLTSNGDQRIQINKSNQIYVHHSITSQDLVFPNIAIYPFKNIDSKQSKQNLIKSVSQEISSFRIDIGKLVLEIRKFKHGLVSTEEQFRFCFMATIEGISKLLN